jgi:hypothetical protein
MDGYFLCGYKYGYGLRISRRTSLFSVHNNPWGATNMNETICGSSECVRSKQEDSSLRREDPGLKPLIGRRVYRGLKPAATPRGATLKRL